MVVVVALDLRFPEVAQVHERKAPEEGVRSGGVGLRGWQVRRPRATARSSQPGFDSRQLHQHSVLCVSHLG